MKCQNCKQRDAVLFYEEAVNGQARKLALCAECAAEMGLASELSLSPLHGLGTGMFDGFFGFAPKQTLRSDKRCPDCNTAWTEIARVGKAFCPTCYQTFAKELEPTLRSLHGAATHTGRMPQQSRALMEKSEKLSTLREALKAAIAEEDFERAATLRDEIRALEKE